MDKFFIALLEDFLKALSDVCTNFVYSDNDDTNLKGGE